MKTTKTKNRKRQLQLKPIASQFPAFVCALLLTCGNSTKKYNYRAWAWAKQYQNVVILIQKFSLDSKSLKKFTKNEG